MGNSRKRHTIINRLQTYYIWTYMDRYRQHTQLDTNPNRDCIVLHQTAHGSFCTGASFFIFVVSDQLIFRYFINSY